MSEQSEKEWRERDDVKWIMSTETGRRFVWRLLSQCGMFHDFEGDTNQILKSVGRRQVGLFLAGIVTDASDDLYYQMTLEAKNKAVEEKKHGDTKHTDADEFERSYGGHASGGDDFPSYDSGSFGSTFSEQYL